MGVFTVHPLQPFSALEAVDEDRPNCFESSLMVIDIIAVPKGPMSGTLARNRFRGKLF
jgi:hypothetical protein